MSVRKLTARICGSLVLLCGLASTQAQQHQFHPATDPFQFDPDFRWFEPIYDADIADMKPKKRANTGWFATYDRTNLYGSRPELNVSQGITRQNLEEGLDSGWGHRYEIGYMLPDKDNGWLFSWVSSNTGEMDITRHEALNRLNEDELGGSATNPAPPFGFEALPFVGNNLGFNYRFIDEVDVLNMFDFDSYELSKTWRLEPYHYGGILEPMVGVRWFRIEDTSSQQNFNSSRYLLNGVPLLTVEYGAQVDEITTFNSFTENEAITAQLGMRYTKHRDRFMFSGDFRVFAGPNFQNSFTSTDVWAFVYDGVDDVDQGDELDSVIRGGPNGVSNTARSYTRNEEFLLGFDVRGEVAYQLTRHLSVRGGFQLIDVARGLWRGGEFAGPNTPGGDNDQDLLLVGGTFGITLNR